MAERLGRLGKVCVLAATLAVTAAGCGSEAIGSGSTPPSGAASGPGTAPRGGAGSSPGFDGTAPTTASSSGSVRSELLTVNELGSGWAVDNSGSEDTTTTAPRSQDTSQCKSLASAGDQGFEGTHDDAQVAFASDSQGDPPNLDEELAAYPSESEASSGWNKLVGELKACKAASLKTSAGDTVTVTVGQISFPTFADRSTAFEYSIENQTTGVTVDVDVLVAQHGDHDALISYGGSDSDPMDGLQQYGRLAVKKLG